MSTTDWGGFDRATRQLAVVQRCEDRIFERETMAALEAERTAHAPIESGDRTHNALRPTTFDDIVGQAGTKALLRRVVQSAMATDRTLDHMLFVGPSGVGKSTFSHVIAHEMDVQVYEVEAPVSHDTLLELREVMSYGDILRIEEIHQQAIMERRGRSSATQPEVLYGIMEDRVIPTPNGLLSFPEITIIGTTTDEGMLPDAFVNRFPLKPVLENYSVSELELIARRNAQTLGIALTPAAAKVFARASRAVPRTVNNYVRNAEALSLTLRISKRDALEVVSTLNHTTVDGLTHDMVTMLTFLYTRARRTNQAGEVTYTASVSTIATALGKSRDAKAIQLRVEPYLIERGYVQVTHGGRRLTDEGINRAKALTGGKP